MENYRKIARIGKGVYGEVILVESLPTKSQFAMKRVPYIEEQSYISEIDRTVDTFNEVNLLSGLNHPNIIKYHEYFIHNDNLCIIMDYASNDWVAQLLLAVKYIHDHKILHRDIKVQNIFLTEDGRIKLGDFGISKKLDRTGELAKTSLGTPYYLSPEICRSQQYSFKSDIWMLGCTIYEICTLKRPFLGESLHEVIHSILTKDYLPMPSDIPPVIHRMIKLMLEKSADDRPDIDELLKYHEVADLIQNCISKNQEYKEVAKTFAGLRPVSYLIPAIKDHPRLNFQALEESSSQKVSSGIQERIQITIKTPSYAEVSARPLGSPAMPGSKGKIAQNNLNFIIQRAKEASSPTISSTKLETKPTTISLNEYQSKEVALLPEEYHSKDAPTKNTSTKFPRTFQKEISINTTNLEENDLKKDTSKSQEEPKIEGEKHQIPTVKMQKKNFSFADTIFNTQAPTSPNRSALFSDFLRQRLGEAKFREMGELLESYDDPLKILDESELVVGILGSENRDCIKIYKYLLSSSVTPGHQRTRSLHIFGNESGDAPKLLENMKTPTNYTIQTKNPPN